MVKIEKYIEKAKRTYLVGQLEQARKNYLAVLQLDPYYTDALHGLGQIASQNGVISGCSRLPGEDRGLREDTAP